MKKINENPIDIRIIVDSFDTNSFNKNTENAIFGENLNDEKKKINTNVCVITYKSNGEYMICFNEEQDTAFTYVETADYPEIIPDKKKSKKQQEAIALQKAEKLKDLRFAALKSNRNI